MTAAMPGGPRPSRAPEADTPETARRRARGQCWAELMRRTFGFDVLACPRCGSRLRLIALIEEATVIERASSAISAYRLRSLRRIPPACRRSPRTSSTRLVGTTTPRCSIPVPDVPDRWPGRRCAGGVAGGVDPPPNAQDSLRATRVTQGPGRARRRIGISTRCRQGRACEPTRRPACATWRSGV